MDRREAEEAGVEPTEDACAPSNGFEARAPHRERYSSGGENAALSGVAKEVLGPALGLAFRALGSGFKVFMVQYIKGKWKTGEKKLADRAFWTATSVPR